ncbi:MAG: ABC transporter permease subunit [Gammaproteobacteria bacterium]|nr:ABC transporter permease subunit [Gammaproteobacteria bacterium]
MVKFIIKRILIGLLTLLGVSLVFFLLIEWSSGDFASIRAHELVHDIEPLSDEFLAQYTQLTGFDRPAHERYFSWLMKMMKGDFGFSPGGGREIAPLLFERFSNTFYLGAVAAFFAVPLAWALGVYCALRRGMWVDRAITSVSTMIYCLPEFLSGYAIVTLLAVKFSLFPSLALAPLYAGSLTQLYHIVLPVLTLVLALAAAIVIPVRAVIISVLARPHLEMAHLKGLRTWRILVFHIMPACIGPVINIVVLAIANLLTGVIIVEIVFVYPGVGQLMVDGVQRQDVALVMGCGVVITTCYVSLIVVADVIGIVSNPKLREKVK